MISDWLKAPVVFIGRTSFDLLIDSGVTPNQVTCAGFALVLCNCAAYLAHQDPFFLGLGLSLSYTFDALDGAVARRLNAGTPFGAYLDTVIDRYQEMAAYLVVALVTGWWFPVFLVTTGALLVSYNKAAAAIQTPIDNKGWPDLMERPRRTWIFCAALMLDNAIYVPAAWGGHFLLLALWYLAFLTHFTALQRFMRGKRLLQAQPALAMKSD